MEAHARPGRVNCTDIEKVWNRRSDLRDRHEEETILVWRAANF